MSWDRGKIIPVIGATLATILGSILPDFLSSYLSSRDPHPLCLVFHVTFEKFCFFFQFFSRFGQKRLTPEFGYAVHPSSAVATLVSMTVSENKKDRAELQLVSKESIISSDPQA